MQLMIQIELFTPDVEPREKAHILLLFDSDETMHGRYWGDGEWEVDGIPLDDCGGMDGFKYWAYLPVASKVQPC